MTEFFEQLFSGGGFMPHGHCYFWKPELIGLHVASDALIALAYYSIPLTLLYFIRKRRDVPYPWIFLMFGGFIVACGTTHLLEIWSVWHGSYWLSGSIKAVTALLSVVTAVMLVKLVPQALLLRGPAELARLNLELEARIRERADELGRTNTSLQTEIAERKRAEELVRRLNTDLERRVKELQAVLDLLPVGVGIARDPQCRDIRMNQTFARTLNLTTDMNGSMSAPPGEAPRTFRVLVNGKELAPEELPMQVAARGVEVREAEEEIILTDGRTLHVLAYATPLRDEANQVCGSVGAFVDITERKRAEAARQASEARARAMLESALDCIVSMDHEGRVIEFNQAAEQAFGRSRAEALGQPMAALMIPPVSQEWDQLAFDRRLATGEPNILGRRIELTALRHDGGVFPIELSVTRIPGSEPPSFTAFLRDITARKADQEALRAANERVTRILNSITDGFVALDGQWRFNYVNHYAAGVIGKLRKSSGELLGRTLWEEFPDLTGTALDLDFRRAIREQVPVGLEFYYPPAKGYFEVRAYPNPDGLAVFFKEITQRKEIEEAHAQFAAIVASSADAIISKTLAGDISSWNPGAEKIFGYPAEEIVGRSVRTLIPPDRADEETGILARIGRGERIDSFETVRVRKDGRQIAVSVTISPIKDGTGRVIGASKIARDITALKEAEERLHASLREKEVMLKEIHHRVKNNLQIVSSLLRLQARSLKGPEPTTAFEESCTRVQSMALVHEKLYQSSSLSELDFAAYTESLTASLLRAFGTDPALIRLKLDMDKVRLDINQAIPCALVLNELVSNALKYAFPDGRAGEIWVRLRVEPDGTVRIVVGDNGVGVPAGLELERPETLGLHLVGTLVRQLRGHLAVRRETGTEFALSFMAAKIEEENLAR